MGKSLRGRLIAPPDEDGARGGSSRVRNPSVHCSSQVSAVASDRRPASPRIGDEPKSTPERSRAVAGVIMRPWLDVSRSERPAAIPKETDRFLHDWEAIVPQSLI